MVYVIAAYSITLGALGLYWALLAHRRIEVEAARARVAGTPLADPRRGFNAGALLLAPFWMLKYGMTVPGTLLLVPTVAIAPLVQRELWLPLLFVGTVPLAAGAALAFVGNRIAVAHTGVEEPDAFSASQLPWALVGIALYTVILPWAWFFLQG
ncbi:MAG: hypothetical protein NXI30_08915 [bacterium]|nr:hypothetical protein [bacterium]